MLFTNKIKSKKTGILTYGITPPKIDISNEKLQILINKHIERIENLPVDGLVIYDLQDEAERINIARPFPYIETIDSQKYANEYLEKLNIPKIIYRCVGKYSEQELTDFIHNPANNSTVFVGAASRNQNVKLSLRDAYNIYKSNENSIVLGGVTIPERHSSSNDEHLRIISKINSGCSFFISQAVYNVENAKNFLSDYFYYSQTNNLDLVPILFTLAPCGSQKTMEFMEWLGIDFPRWLENDLLHSPDILESSVKHCLRIADELIDFCSLKNIPIGFNVESVSVRKVEIEASIFLTEELRAKL